MTWRVLVSNEQWVGKGRGAGEGKGLTALGWDLSTSNCTNTRLRGLSYPVSVGRIKSTWNQHIWTTWIHPRTREEAATTAPGTGAGEQNKSCLSSQLKGPRGETAFFPAFEVPSKPPLEHEFWQLAHGLCVSAGFLQKYLNSRKKNVASWKFEGRIFSRQDTVSS